MTKCAALPHRVPGARNTDKHRSAGGIPHCQAVLVRADVKHGNVDASCLLDDRHEIAKRLYSQVVIPTEPPGGLAAFYFCCHVQAPGSDRCRDRLVG